MRSTIPTNRRDEPSIWRQLLRLLQLMRSTRTSPGQALELLLDRLSYYDELDRLYEERRHVDRPAAPLDGLPF